MNILNDLLSTLPDGNVVEARIGLHCTSAVIESGGLTGCGLAATLDENHQNLNGAAQPQIGHLEEFSGRELASLSLSSNRTMASAGVAAINALLAPEFRYWMDLSAEEAIAQRCSGKTVALIGNFSQADRLKSHLGQLSVIECNPHTGNLIEDRAYQVLPEADVVAIDSMTLINHTLENLLELCSPHAYVILFGISTPLSSVLFDYGINMLSGFVTTASVPVMKAVSQGANSRQVCRTGVRCATISSQEMHFSFEDNHSLLMQVHSN
jgi:uncharacterized protein